MRIGILGAGDVALSLGTGLISLGHEVKVSSRNPSKENIVRWISKQGRNASAGSFKDAALFGDIVIVATSWSGTADAIAMADSKNFREKIVIDVTNPLDFSKMPPVLAVGHTNSAGEIIQGLLSDAKVVKAFNIVGNPHFVHPEFPGGPPTMFICGNDLKAKEKITEILDKFGWETIDAGTIEQSRLLESLAMLWITHYFKTGQGNHAFKLLKK